MACQANGVRPVENLETSSQMWHLAANGFPRSCHWVADGLPKGRSVRKLPHQRDV
jgi:hypothetical protein